MDSILRKFQITGKLGDDERRLALQYIDTTQVYDLATASEKAKELEAAMMSLPAKVRALFGNNVLNMVDYIGNPDNSEMCIQLGLLPKPVSEPVKGVEHPPLDVTVPTDTGQSQQGTAPKKEEKAGGTNA